MAESNEIKDLKKQLAQLEKAVQAQAKSGAETDRNLADAVTRQKSMTVEMVGDVNRTLARLDARVRELERLCDALKLKVKGMDLKGKKISGN